MSHEAKLALEKIVGLCERSDNLSGRQCRIFEMALEGLGHVAKQRREILDKWTRPRIEKKREKLLAKRERQAAQYQEAA